MKASHTSSSQSLNFYKMVLKNFQHVVSSYSPVPPDKPSHRLTISSLPQAEQLPKLPPPRLIIKSPGVHLFFDSEPLIKA